MAGSSKDKEEPLAFETSEDVEIVPSFDAMGLKDELLRGICACHALHTPSSSPPIPHRPCAYAPPK